MAKIIRIKSCRKCPYRTSDNGGGFIEPFELCEHSNFVLMDEDSWMDLDTIHPNCKLEDADIVVSRR